MNPYAYSVLAFGFCSFFIGLLVWAKLGNKIGFHYFLFSGISGMWGMIAGLVYSGSLDDHIVLFASRLAHTFAMFVGPAWYHFTVIFSSKSKSKYADGKRICLYMISGVILTFSFSKFFIPQITEFMVFKHCPEAGPLYPLFTALFFTAIPMGFWELFRRLRELKGKEKKQCWSLIIATSAGFIGGSFTFALPYHIAFPQYGMLIMPLYPLFMGFAMMKLGLLNEENLILAAHKDKLAALGILTASINHEIRAPLFVIRGTMEMESQNDKLNSKVLAQVDRITGIVSRLTHFAKKGVEEEAKIEAIDLKEILSDIRPLFQHQLSYQHIEYSQELPNDLPKVMADRRYLEEILFNLILNACQAVRETKNPIIKLSASSLRRQGSKTPDQVRNDSLGRQSSVPASPAGRVSPSSIVITIADNGPGIAPDQQKNIFKPFHTTKSEGTGLGLYITKQLVEKCGGKIEVQSELGKGASFSLVFRAS